MDDWWKLSAQLLGVDGFLCHDWALPWCDVVRHVYRSRGALLNAQTSWNRHVAIVIVDFVPLRHYGFL
jgi:hypothetical protein